MSLKDLRDRVADKAAGREEPSAPMIVRKDAKFKMTAGEMREACEANPEHPLAVTFMNATKGMPDAHQIAVDLVDLSAVLENRMVGVDETTAEHRGQTVRVQTKVLGETLDKPSRPSSPPRRGPVVAEPDA